MIEALICGSFPITCTDNETAKEFLPLNFMCEANANSSLSQIPSNLWKFRSRLYRRQPSQTRRFLERAYQISQNEHQHGDKGIETFQIFRVSTCLGAATFYIMSFDRKGHEPRSMSFTIHIVAKQIYGPTITYLSYI